jgi:hypothetical protein
MIRDEIHAENRGGVIPMQVQWLVNPHSVRERRQRGEISASSVIFAVQGNKPGSTLVKEGIKVVGVCYQVTQFTTVGQNSRREHCCGWGHVERKSWNNTVCCDCSGPHHTSTHKCIVVGCIATQGSPCCHTKEKCTNNKRYDTTFGRR